MTRHFMHTLLTHHIIRLAAGLSVIAVAILIGVYSVIPAPDVPAPQVSDKLKHLAAYLALSVPLSISLGPRRSLQTFMLVVSYGIFMETAQAMGSAGREASLFDILANITGTSLGIVTIRLARGC